MTSVNYLDTDAIRKNFRLVVGRGTVFMLCVSLLHAAAFLRYGMPYWTLHLVFAVLCLPCRWMVSVKRPFALFLGGVLLLFTMLASLETYLTLKLGSEAGFHLLLIPAIPIVVMSGRIGLGSKVLVCALLTAYLTWLDHTAASYAELPARGIDRVRTLNLMISLTAIAAITLQYFALISFQHAKLQELATIDPLTGLYNRRHMHQIAAQVLEQSRRHGYPFSVILADLDHFKSINDRWGHDAGDAVLRFAANIFHAGVRESDSVGRWGGEEILVILPHTSPQEAAKLAERVRALLTRTPVEFRGASIAVTATFGVSSVASTETLEAAVARADLALYEGKSAGRNRVIVHDVVAANATEPSHAPPPTPTLVNGLAPNA